LGRARLDGVAIIGTHALLYTTEPDAVRAIFRDVLGFDFVDTGHDWLIFALPPAELGVHPGEGPTFDAGVRHQLSFMCDDLDATIDELRAKGIDIQGEPQNEGWGITTTMVLPGGLDVMLYQPRHPLAITPS
jgi:catechol 2,3-dioxygenase-like lactoylglutathione lyase family enzyme